MLAFNLRAFFWRGASQCGSSSVFDLRLVQLPGVPDVEEISPGNAKGDRHDLHDTKHRIGPESTWRSGDKSKGRSKIQRIVLLVPAKPAIVVSVSGSDATVGLAPVWIVSPILLWIDMPLSNDEHCVYPLPLFALLQPAANLDQEVVSLAADVSQVLLACRMVSFVTSDRQYRTFVMQESIAPAFLLL